MELNRLHDHLACSNSDLKHLKTESESYTHDQHPILTTSVRKGTLDSGLDISSAINHSTQRALKSHHRRSHTQFSIPSLRQPGLPLSSKTCLQITAFSDDHLTSLVVESTRHLDQKNQAQHQTKTLKPILKSSANNHGGSHITDYPGKSLEDNGEWKYLATWENQTRMADEEKSSAANRIRQAFYLSIHELNLHDCRLIDLPFDAMSRLTHITSLNLEHNDLGRGAQGVHTILRLSDLLKKFTNLQRLHLGSIDLSGKQDGLRPPSFFIRRKDIPKTQSVIDSNERPVSAICEAIGNLSNLQSLSLLGNGLWLQQNESGLLAFACALAKLATHGHLQELTLNPKEYRNASETTKQMLYAAVESLKTLHYIQFADPYYSLDLRQNNQPSTQYLDVLKKELCIK